MSQVSGMQNLKLQFSRDSNHSASGNPALRASPTIVRGQLVNLNQRKASTTPSIQPNPTPTNLPGVPPANNKLRRQESSFTQEEIYR